MATHSEAAAVDTETAVVTAEEGSKQAASLPPIVHTFSSASEGNSTTITTTTTKDSAHDSGITFLRPHPEQQRDTSSQESKYMKLIEDFNAALSKACEAGKALQDCRMEEKRKGLDICLLEKDESYCLEERKDYKEKCEELRKYEKHLKEAYESEYKELKVRLRKMEKQQETSDKDHQITVEAMEQKHCMEVNELTRKISMQANLEKLQSEAFAAAKLKEMKQQFSKKHEEVECLKTQLAKKEKELYQLEKRIETEEMIMDREHMKEQLQTCTEIEEMVSRLPDIDCEKIESLVRDIAAAIEEMKGKTGSKENRRAVSWRQ